MPRHRSNPRNYFVQTPDDGLLCYEIGPWAEDKYRRVGMYAEMFATGMKNRWDSRVYLDLFAGPGHSVLRGTDRRYLGSPLIALSLPNPFDRYIFADESEDAIRALARRAQQMREGTDLRFILGDANEKVDQIVGEIPNGGGVLSFCFLDPYKLNIHFDTVRRLAEQRSMDFLILLALYVDANRNVDRYATEESDVIDRFLGDQEWRPRWGEARAEGRNVVPFLAEEYSRRMESLGYLPMTLQQMVKIRTHDRRLPLYYLAFFSRHPKGLGFWNEVLKYSDDQLPLI